jgi:predicted nucleic acid-binding protein
MPNQTVVSNSTPIIALLKIGRLGILEGLYGAVIIPKAVYEEVTVKDGSVLDGFGWIDVRNIANIAAKEAFAAVLHEGEVEVMLLAKEIGAGLIILDDGLARKHARYLHLTVTGTVGVLLRAKQDGIINEIRPVLDDLVRQGFYISDDVFREVLRLAGEIEG